MPRYTIRYRYRDGWSHDARSHAIHAETLDEARDYFIRSYGSRARIVAIQPHRDNPAWVSLDDVPRRRLEEST